MAIGDMAAQFREAIGRRLEQIANNQRRPAAPALQLTGWQEEILGSMGLDVEQTRRFLEQTARIHDVPVEFLTVGLDNYRRSNLEAQPHGPATSWLIAYPAEMRGRCGSCSTDLLLLVPSVRCPACGLRFAYIEDGEQGGIITTAELVDRLNTRVAPEYIKATKPIRFTDVPAEAGQPNNHDERQ